MLYAIAMGQIKMSRFYGSLCISVKLCDPLVTNGPYLSALEIFHDKALYKFTFTLLFYMPHFPVPRASYALHNTLTYRQGRCKPHYSGKTVKTSTNTRVNEHPPFTPSVPNRESPHRTSVFRKRQ